MGLYISKLTFLLSFQISLFSFNHTERETYDFWKSEFFTPEFNFNQIDLQSFDNAEFISSELQNFAELVFKKESFSYLPFINGTTKLVTSKYYLHSEIDYNGKDIITINLSEPSDLSKASSNLATDFTFSLSHESNEFIQRVSAQTLLSLIPILPEYRFNDSVFSWENFESLKIIQEADALIPPNLLDAIVKSNFEIFFQQKQLFDEELLAIYLNVIHGNPETSISTASTPNFSSVASYLVIGGVLCMFISKYLNHDTTKT